MISIILAASPEVEEKALAEGFRKETVLIRQEGGLSTPENKQQIESKLFKLRPFQFLVSDYWGMGPD